MKLLPKNILAIDDSLTLRKFIEKALVNEDCVNHLLLASDSKMGLEMAINAQPDLILCDYTLPEIKGDELCRRLAATPETAHIPVILMSSSGQEMSTLDLQHTNIIRLLVKPFSRELLVATVSYVLNHWEQKKSAAESAQTVGTVIMRGKADAATICDILRVIARDKHTGVLRINVNGRIVHVFCKEGLVRMVSTRDVEEYLKGTPFLRHGRKSHYWKSSEEKQRETLSPFLMNLSVEGILPTQTAQTLTKIYGHLLFSKVWTERELSYEFEKISLPAFVDLCPPREERINDWILDNLRNVDSAQEIESILADPQGVPTFTPEGYSQLQEIYPRKDEWQILSLINGSTRFKEICQKLRAHPDLVARKIFYYQRLGFVVYWPSYALEGETRN